MRQEHLPVSFVPAAHLHEHIVTNLIGSFALANLLLRNPNNIPPWKSASSEVLRWSLGEKEGSSVMSRSAAQQAGEDSRLAHDVNNALGVILGRCETLSGLLAQNAEAVKQLKVIEDAARCIGNSVAKSPRT
jgi:hypothetical protein